MIELYYWPTPNGHKITMMLEESGLPYRITPIDIGRGDQFKAEFLKISPNNRMPAIIDQQPAAGGAPIAIFESGAILQYLAEKTGRFLPEDVRGRFETLQWLFWQVGGLGPMAGQNHHFTSYAPERIPYATERYVNETTRLYTVLNKRLADRDFINGIGYSIADIACYPWVLPHEDQRQDMRKFPDLQRWLDAIQQRPATQRAYEIGERVNQRDATVDDEARKFLFGQSAETIQR